MGAKRVGQGVFGIVFMWLVSGLGGCSAPSQPWAAKAPATDVAAAPPPPVVSVAPGAPSEAVAEAAPSMRPGLGTEWGEDRESPIRDVSFYRADPSRPIALSELRYDDERGVRGLASYVADRGARTHETMAVDGAIAVWLEDGHDNPLDVVQVAGQTFVVGEAGERYTIVLENRTPRRFEVVTTVDGLDVMSGKPGALRNRGYILMPYARIEIDGFRQSESTVAAFRFGRVKDSYAAEVGSARNVGVIGMAFFNERGDSWSADGRGAEVRRRMSARPFPADGRFAPPPPGRGVWSGNDE